MTSHPWQNTAFIISVGLLVFFGYSFGLSDIRRTSQAYESLGELRVLVHRDGALDLKEKITSVNLDRLSAILSVLEKVSRKPASAYEVRNAISKLNHDLEYGLMDEHVSSVLIEALAKMLDDKQEIDYLRLLKLFAF